MNIKKYIQKLQNLPLTAKKIILWSIVGIMGAGMLVLWLHITQIRLAKINNQDLMNSIVPGINEVQK